MEKAKTTSSSPIVEKVKLYKESEKLLARAKEIFPSTGMYDSFKGLVDAAYKNGNLDSVKFAIDSFETLKSFENSPQYAQQVDLLSADPLFKDFADMLIDLSPKLDSSDPAFKGTDKFNESLKEELTPTETENLVVKTEQEKELVKPQMPDFHERIIVPETGAGETAGKHIGSYEDVKAAIPQKTVENIQQIYKDATTNPDATQAEMDALEATLDAVQAKPEYDAEASHGSSENGIKDEATQLAVDSALSQNVSNNLEDANTKNTAPNEAFEEELRRIVEIEIEQ